MGPMKKNVNVGGNSFYEDLNDERDARLARRLQRSSAATITFKKQNLSVNPAKRTLDDVQNGEESVEPSYATYFNADVYSEGHSLDDDDDDDGDNDPEYVMGLKHLREDAKSYILEVTIDVMCMIVKYEEENELDDDLKHKSSQSLKDGSCGHKVEMEPVWRNIIREEKKEHPTTFGSASSKGRKISVVEKDAKAESRANGSLSQKRDHVAHYQPEINHDMRSYMVNQSYEYFLSCLKKVGDTMVFKTEDGKYLRYEEEEDSSSDSDSLVVLLTGNIPSCFKGNPHTPPVTSKTLLLKGSSSRTSSKFREKLMDILRKPFDKKEYKELLVEASHRKPIEGHRRMRNVEKTYTTKKIGKSYLDLYPDLANKIYSVRNTRHRVLYLLRGFFYWLQNLSQEGAFLPWLDESCLELMQRL